MVVLAFVLFVTITVAHNSGIYTITLLRQIHDEIILMRYYLNARLLFIKVMAKLTFPLPLIRWSWIIIFINIRNKVVLVSFLL